VSGSGNCIYTNRAIAPTTNNNPNLHYYIGGLFGIHERVNDAYSCASAPIREDEVINLEAFLWAIERYKFIHPNVSIGGVAFDTCSRFQQTLEDILSFETCKIQLNDVNPPTPRNLLAYIGPGDDYDAMSSARLLKDMNKTQVSYGASSIKLSNKREMYDFFLRTVPSEAIKLKALSLFIGNALNAKYVQVLHTSDEYGMVDYMYFKEEAAKRNICIVYHAGVSADPSDAELTTIANAITQKKSARHVVVLSSKGLARVILQKIKDYDVNAFSELLFFGTWDSSVVNGLGVSAYATSLKSPDAFDSDVTAFYNYLNNLRPVDNARNRNWFQEYLNAKLNCISNNCQNQTLQGKYERSPYVPYTLAAVKAVIQGIKDGATRACSSGDLCSTYLNTNNRGQQIYTGIVNVQDGSTGMQYFQSSGTMIGDASNSFSSLMIYLYEAPDGQQVTMTEVRIITIYFNLDISMK
jgi:ABC-type branched-subunit amino acid transport system substrate-binding protein